MMKGTETYMEKNATMLLDNDDKALLKVLVADGIPAKEALSVVQQVCDLKRGQLKTRPLSELLEEI